jgi:predicted enzyme related to lactoylglutathione lyase
MPSPERPVPPAPGTIGWHELHTSDIDGAFDFYSNLFGWTKQSDMDMGPMGIYRIFDQGDHKQMGDGGMMTKGPHMPVSAWAFYFCVDSIAAAVKRVESGGGKIMYGPAQVPGGGWIINGQDPQGAMFNLVANSE